MKIGLHRLFEERTITALGNEADVLDATQHELVVLLEETAKHVDHSEDGVLVDLANRPKIQND